MTDNDIITVTVSDEKEVYRGRDLVDAAYRGNFEKVKALIEIHGVDPNEWENTSMPALIADCARDGHGPVNVLEYLLSKGADPNLYTAEKDGLSALKSAAKYKHYDKVRLLLEHGADPNYERGGEVALTIAVDTEYHEEDSDQEEFMNDDFAQIKPLLDLLVPVTDPRYYQKTYTYLVDQRLRDHLVKLTPSHAHLYRNPELCSYGRTISDDSRVAFGDSTLRDSKGFGSDAYKRSRKDALGPENPHLALIWKFLDACLCESSCSECILYKICGLKYSITHHEHMHLNDSGKVSVDDEFKQDILDIFEQFPTLKNKDPYKELYEHIHFW